MKEYFRRVYHLIIKLGLVLLLFVLSQVFFFFYNNSLFSNVGIVELFSLLFIGMRFHLSVIIYFNILLILLSIMPVGRIYYSKAYQQTINILYISINTLLIFINLGDSVFFHFTQKRSTIDVLKFIFISDDALGLIPKFALDYWFVGIFIVIIAYILSIPHKRMKKIIPLKPDNRIITIVYKSLIMLILLGLSLIGARGGLQLRPLSIMHATNYCEAKLVPIVLNTPFTLMTTYGHNDVKEFRFFSEKEVNKNYPLIKEYGEGKFKNKNIIIILLESFSREYIGSLNNYKGYTPFLDSLISQSLVFTNAFSSGYRSMDAIPSAVAGVPCLIDDPIITSVYGNNHYTSLADILNKKGYSTAFFHGGTNGTLGLDGFVNFLGFKKYYGRNEYNNDEDFDGYWGIYDEPFLQFMVNKVDEMPQPFFAMEFTLSSHYPYSLPKKYQGKIKESELRIHKVVRYTDLALKHFFKEASKKEWFKNTIFIISADHPAQSVIPNSTEDVQISGNLPSRDRLEYYKNTSGRYAIPVLIYSPGDTLLKGIYDKTFHQCDIMPTALDMLNYNSPFIAFGNSAFDTTAQRIAVHYVNGLYQITSGNYCLLFNGEKSIALYEKTDLNHSQNLISKNKEVAAKLEKTLKAYLQHYSTRMRSNSMVLDN